MASLMKKFIYNHLQDTIRLFLVKFANYEGPYMVSSGLLGNKILN